MDKAGRPFGSRAFRSVPVGAAPRPLGCGAYCPSLLFAQRSASGLTPRAVRPLAGLRSGRPSVARSTVQSDFGKILTLKKFLSTSPADCLNVALVDCRAVSVDLGAFYELSTFAVHN